MDARPEHDGEIRICGQDYLFRRTHDLLRRIEQRFGALLPLALKVERFGVTQSELAAIYEELVRGDPGRPVRAQLEQWIWDEGTPKLCAPLARVLYELPVGNRTLRLLEEEKMIAAAEQAEQRAKKNGTSVRPTQPAVAPAQMDPEELHRILNQAMAKADRPTASTI